MLGTLKATGAVFMFLILRICPTSTVKGPPPNVSQLPEVRVGFEEGHTAEFELRRFDLDRHGGRSLFDARYGSGAGRTEAETQNSGPTGDDALGLEIDKPVGRPKETWFTEMVRNGQSEARFAVLSKGRIKHKKGTTRWVQVSMDRPGQVSTDHAGPC